MTKNEMDFCLRLAHGIAEQFGANCEIAIHDLESKDPEHSIVAIEHGEITGRKVGDGPSHIVIEAMQHGSENLEDKLAYLTRTKDGRILRSSTIYIRNSRGKVTGIFSINYDITLLIALGENIRSLTDTGEDGEEPEAISQNVSDLLEDLISQSIKLVGKPVALMSKEDKLKAIRFLNDSGAMLITKSGPRICEVFGFSKYTLYNYLEEIKQENKTEK
ncbi:MAG: helix-turn-helix transcriptional regulator [Bilifractor sp.]|jgi:predicted transcriptional regulator YheO